jgi:hypothetical protein
MQQEQDVVKEWIEEKEHKLMEFEFGDRLILFG